MTNTEITFAVGDVHGCLDKLRKTIAACRAYADGRTATFVMLGDYIDRGPDSRGVLDLLMNWAGPERLICLKGNHEDLLLLALAHPEAAGAAWLGNGGRNTLWSYGILHAHQIPIEVTEWMEKLPLFHDDGLRFFCHAGIDPDRPLAAQRPEVLMYARRKYPEDFDPGRFVVHGHTALAVAVPPVHPHRLNLDTSACAGGPLSASAFLAGRRDPAALIVDGRVIELAPSQSAIPAI